MSLDSKLFPTALVFSGVFNGPLSLVATVPAGGTDADRSDALWLAFDDAVAKYGRSARAVLEINGRQVEAVQATPAGQESYLGVVRS